jgi:N-acetylmuramoyl-L-alanine amidase
MKMTLLKRVCLILILLFIVVHTSAQEKDTPRSGEGIYAILRRNNRNTSGAYEEFIKLNKGKLGKNNSLKKGVYYFLPPLPNQPKTKKTKTANETKNETANETKTYRQPLFGKDEEEYSIKDRILAGACFFLVSGHGGPDSGAIAWVDGYALHEDEYAYDIMLRLAKILLEHGATVHIIIQDPKDGIRNDKYLNTGNQETCMGKTIPLSQTKRLKQRCDVINDLNYKAKEDYKRAIFIHLDSRSKKEQLDVFFYYQDDAGNKKRSQSLAKTMAKTFREQYNKHQPSRGFSGTITTRHLYVLENTNPVSIFVELANMQNINDQKRYLLENNRQALAKWLSMGFITDYQQSQ